MVGCVAPVYNYRAEATEVSEPPLNVVSTAQVGDEMLKQGKFFEADAIVLEHDLKIGAGSPYTLSAGYYLKAGENQTTEFYQPAPGAGGGHVTKRALVDPWQAIQLSKSNDKIYIVTVFDLHVGSKPDGVRHTKRLSLSDDSFEQTLIYSGKVGDKIKIGYREFSNSQARPAFNNDVDYDLSESKVIGYKGARIEVVEATNQYIRYRVIQNFNAATF
jgi:hypothetical protein